MNIVEMIEQSIRGEIAGKLGRPIGEDDQKTRTAATAAVPALLASLAHVASSDQGARRLDDAMSQPGVSDELPPVVQPILDKLNTIAGNPPH